MSGTTSTTTNTSSTTISPIYRLKRVLYGVSGNLEQILGLEAINDTSSTLNTKYGVQPATLPSTHPTLSYFGIGNKGKRNIDSSNLSQPQEISAENMDIYGPLPIRCVPVEQDLSDTERANYAMREIITAPNGDKYVAYWLKLLTKVSSKVQFFKLDSSGNQQTYVPDYSNLSPTPPTTTTDGTAADVGSEINAVAVVTVELSGSELAEGINVLYGGDARYATISEIGLYTGTPQSVTTTDAQSNMFSYTESVMTQLHTHYTFNGFDLSTPNAIYSEQFSFGSGRVILL